MDFDYTFSVPCGPERYSAQTDEYFCDEKDVYWTYEVTTKEVCKALLDMASKKSLDEKLAEIWEELVFDKEDLLLSLGVTTFEELLQQAKKYVVPNTDGIKMLEYILDDVEYYAREREDDLKEYFEEDAYDDYRYNRDD